MPFLLLLKKNVPQVKFSLSNTSTIGRSSECEIQVPDLKTSRRHALIYINGPDYCLKDLESENGTYLNGKCIHSLVKIKDGDEIQIGDHVFIFNPPLDILHERKGDKSLLLVSEEPAPAVEYGSLLHCDEFEPVNGNTFQSIYDFLCDITSELDLDVLLNKLISKLIAYFSADRGYILSYDSKIRKCRPLVIITEKENMALSSTLLDMAVAEKRPLLVHDALEDISFAEGKSILKHQLRSVMLIPLIAKEDIIGFIQLDKKEKKAFDINTLNRFSLISKVAALAFYNAQKFERESKKDIHITGMREDKCHTFIGQSPCVIELLTKAEKAAYSDARVIIEGESGTGKELIAHMIHEMSPRTNYPWIAINCAAIPENLLESELFGHEKGAFTGAVKQKKGCFELADDGTLFLDEIAEISPSVQVKLLRVLQEGRFFRVGGETSIAVDVRVVCATNKDLKNQVRENLFREDLYFRLNVITLHVPPLRNRKEDIELLCSFFIERYSGELGKKAPEMSSEAIFLLKNYAWPGNIRELQNAMERTIVLFDNDEIREGDLPGDVRMPDFNAEAFPIRGSLHDTLAIIEKKMLITAMKKAHFKKVDAARMLGISRPTLDKKIKVYNIK